MDAHAGNPPIGIRRFHLLNSYSRNGPQITSFHNTASVSVTFVPDNFFTVVSSSCCVYMIYKHYHVNLESNFNSNFGSKAFFEEKKHRGMQVSTHLRNRLLASQVPLRPERLAIIVGRLVRIGTVN